MRTAAFIQPSNCYSSTTLPSTSTDQLAMVELEVDNKAQWDVSQTVEWAKENFGEEVAECFEGT